jgi:hypothetical protein
LSITPQQVHTSSGIRRRSGQPSLHPTGTGTLLIDRELHALAMAAVAQSQSSVCLWPDCTTHLDHGDRYCYTHAAVGILSGFAAFATTEQVPPGPAGKILSIDFCKHHCVFDGCVQAIRWGGVDAHAQSRVPPSPQVWCAVCLLCSGLTRFFYFHYCPVPSFRTTKNESCGGASDEHCEMHRAGLFGAAIRKQRVVRPTHGACPLTPPLPPTPTEYCPHTRCVYIMGWWAMLGPPPHPTTQPFL